MYRTIRITSFTILAAIILIAFSCKKKDLAVLSTAEVSNIKAFTATCGGNISGDGGETITARGICYSTNPDPDLSDNYTTDGAHSGTFISNMTGLAVGSTYYVRAYATNSNGTEYGNQVTFTTTYTLGDTYQGGIIYNISGTYPNQHGLVAASADQSAAAAWWNGSNMVTNATSNTEGATNTTTIINLQGNTGSYAAKLCRDYNGGGYNDWYLPAKDELIALIGQYASVGNLSPDYYWSSTEDSNLNDHAYVYSSFMGLNEQVKSSNLHVRAIRAF
jgi:hypothetical protein